MPIDLRRPPAARARRLRLWLALALSAICVGCAPLPIEADAGAAGASADGGEPMDTVITGDDYDTRCATDADCRFALLGDVCGCGCDGIGISADERVRYAEDVNARRALCGEIPDCAACPDPYLWCEGGTCRARTGTGPCGCPRDEVCVQRYDSACRGGALLCAAGDPRCQPDPATPIGDRSCDPGCADTVCGLPYDCQVPLTCGARAAAPERPEALHCYTP